MPYFDIPPLFDPPLDPMLRPQQARFEPTVELEPSQEGFDRAAVRQTLPAREVDLQWLSAPESVRDYVESFYDTLVETNLFRWQRPLSSPVYAPESVEPIVTVTTGQPFTNPGTHDIQFAWGINISNDLTVVGSVSTPSRATQITLAADEGFEIRVPIYPNGVEGFVVYANGHLMPTATIPDPDEIATVDSNYMVQISAIPGGTGTDATNENNLRPELLYRITDFQTPSPVQGGDKWNILMSVVEQRTA